jgi:hypothetical protein
MQFSPPWCYNYCPLKSIPDGSRIKKDGRITQQRAGGDVDRLTTTDLLQIVESSSSIFFSQSV